MWPQSRLTELLGIAHPIVQAPMAGFSTPALAAAVSNAGGLGSLGCALLGPEQLRAGLRDVARRDQPAGQRSTSSSTRAPVEDPARRARMQARLRPYYDELGIALPDPAPEPPPPFDDGQPGGACCSERPGVVSFHFGLPQAAHLEALREAGIHVLSSATTVEEARWLEAQGVAAVIAQGYEAGGHRGTFQSPLEAARIGTMALVPQIVDAVACPVIAAGGIMDGRGIAAALMLGAAGVQLGTAFLGCPEASVSPLHRAALRASERRHPGDQGVHRQARARARQPLRPGDGRRRGRRAGVPAAAPRSQRRSRRPQRRAARAISCRSTPARARALARELPAAAAARDPGRRDRAGAGLGRH